MPEITVWETECGNCGGSCEESGYVLIERDTYDIVVICSNCYDSSEEEYGTIYLSWE